MQEDGMSRQVTDKGDFETYGGLRLRWWGNERQVTANAYGGTEEENKWAIQVWMKMARLVLVRKYCEPQTSYSHWGMFYAD
jgi:hypothetical protein